MSETETVDEERASLDDRLTSASVQIEDIVETAKELRDRAKGLSTRNRRELPRHGGEWSEAEVRSYLTRLEQVVSEPQVAQSESRLKEIGLDEDEIDTIVRDELTDSEIVDELSGNYETLVEDFGDLAEFLVDDGHILEWIRDEGPEETRDKLDFTEKAKYERLVGLEHLPHEFKKRYFRGAILGSRSISGAEQFDNNLATLESYDVGIDPDPGIDLSEFSDLCEQAVSRIRTLRDDYGYGEEEISEWVEGKDVEEAENELESKQDKAGSRRDALREEVREYCEILDEEVPEVKTIPELEEKAERFREQLAEEVGTTGQQLFRYLQGEIEELPPDIDRDDLVEGLKGIRPMIQDRLHEEKRE